jgi:hypothetical protein
MSTNCREWVSIVEETAYGTANASPTIWTTATTYGLANAQQYYMRLDTGNAFTMRSVPTTVEVPFGGGFRVGAYATSDKQIVSGQLSVILSVSHAPFLLSWALQRINAGQTAPWTTTEPAGDLASCTVYHAINMNGTVKRQSYPGCKPSSFALAVSEDGTLCRATIGLTAQKFAGNTFDASSDPTTTPFPDPLDTYFPIDPYVFIYAGGSNYVTLDGSVRTKFSELNFNVENTLVSRFYANRWIQLLRWVGRDTMVSTKVEFDNYTDRQNFYQVATGSASVELSNGTHGFTIGMNSQNYVAPLGDDLPLADLYMQTFTSNNLYDTTAGSDLTLTIA